ncbi:MAG: hypothetical protein H7330_14345 [Hymenobacteraceae bacterium]|nr:hypothetical protein [Hymenobacteraceae bacterium]
MRHSLFLVTLLWLGACASANSSQLKSPVAYAPNATDTIQAPPILSPDTAMTSSAAPDTAYLNPANVKAKYQPYDFSQLWQYDAGRLTLGFIGKDYQRLRMVLLRVRQDEHASDLYHVEGQSKVKGICCSLIGTIRLQYVWELKPEANQLSGDAETTAFVAHRGQLRATYEFREARNGPHTGTFRGTLKTDWLLAKDGHIRYDDLEMNADGYANNQFAGEWRSYDGKLHYRANWGDNRIPESGPLDVGVGQFKPDSAYVRYGWQSYVKAINSRNKQGWDRETARWWR